MSSRRFDTFQMSFDQLEALVKNIGDPHKSHLSWCLKERKPNELEQGNLLQNKGVRHVDNKRNNFNPHMSYCIWRKAFWRALR